MSEQKTNVFYHGDCLFVMRHDIPTESIELIEPKDMLRTREE